MNKNELLGLLKRVWVPLLLIVLGLILLFNPDSASTLVAKVIGWILFIAGAGCGCGALFGASRQRPRLVLGALVLLGMGGFVLANPLILAEILGRFFGVLLIIRGIADFIDVRRENRGPISMGIAIVTGIAGLVLTLMPLTLSRVILNICGLVLAAIGIASLLDRLRSFRRLDDGGDPNIIDADQ